MNCYSQGKWEESLSSLRGFFGLDTRTLEDDMRALMMKGKTKIECKIPN